MICTITKKIAFQYDAYCPLVDWGGYCTGRGVLCRGAFCAGGGAVHNRKLHHNTSPPPTDRQTGVKTLPCPKLRLRAVEVSVSHREGQLVNKTLRIPGVQRHRFRFRLVKILNH